MSTFYACSSSPFYVVRKYPFDTPLEETTIFVSTFARTGASLLLYKVRICAFDISFIELSFVGIYFFTHNYRVLIFPFDIADIQSIVCVYFFHALVPCFYTVRIFPFDTSSIESFIVCVYLFHALVPSCSSKRSGYFLL